MEAEDSLIFRDIDAIFLDKSCFVLSCYNCSPLVIKACVQWLFDLR